MLLFGVCSLSACDVTLLPSWIRVAIIVRQHIPDLISDSCLVAIWFAGLLAGAPVASHKYEQTVIFRDTIFLAVHTHQSIGTHL